MVIGLLPKPLSLSPTVRDVEDGGGSFCKLVVCCLCCLSFHGSRGVNICNSSRLPFSWPNVDASVSISDADPTAPHPSPSPLTPSLESTQQLSISAQSGNQVTLPWTLSFNTLDPLDLHPIDISIRVIAQRSLIRAFHARPAASLRLSGASRASPKRSRPPPHLRPGPPSLTPAHLRSASRLPAWACRPSPGSRSALTSRTAEQRHRPPTRHANCNPPSALPWVGAALLWSHQSSSGTTCRSNTRKTPAPRFRIQLHPDVDGRCGFGTWPTCTSMMTRRRRCPISSQ